MHRRWTMTAAAVVAGLAAVLVAGQVAAAPRTIPDRVMLQAEDLGGAVPGPVADDLAFQLLPQPCAGVPVPQPRASRGLSADHGPRARVHENVARYPRAGAKAYLDTLKAQLATCRAGGGDNGFRTVAEDHLGPDTVLFEYQYDEGDRWVAYVAAAVGRYVVVVLVTDPVVGAGDLTLANTIASAAIRRAAA
ncbi:hypothetical protein [Actinoplanes sp. NPDC051494]|uniref:hypothetical protein n=1 Tax=Actinoplanes sp. NPDC051494 TaxID=3363907 RepID=UPI00379CB908